MHDALEAVDGLAADALGGTVGCDQLGVSGLQALQLLEKLVELLVGDFVPGFDVIKVVVVVDETSKLLDALLDAGHDTLTGQDGTALPAS
jgi:hypothetical protein